jgi:hypothetical protein
MFRQIQLYTIAPIVYALFSTRRVMAHLAVIRFTYIIYHMFDKLANVYIFGLSLCLGRFLLKCILASHFSQDEAVKTSQNKMDSSLNLYQVILGA